jgi:DNA-nicking Smr family endonuclease
MSKKKKKEKPAEGETQLPKFGGFKPLAGLEQFKKKMEAEAKKPPPSAPAKPPQPQKRRDIPKSTAAEDELSFHRMMSGVVPLDDRSGHARVPVTSEARTAAPRVKADEMRARAKAEAEQALEHLHQLVDDGVRFEVSDDGKRVEGRRTDVPPNVVRSLRRGLFPIDARLDLHGATMEEAREKLLAFLRETRTRGERCVLVIHGKGDHTAGGGGGVLRGEISAWLSQGRAREHVAAFATATDADGGEGAVYVALRR